MTVAAADLAVPSLQAVPGTLVIEGFGAGLRPVDHLEPPAVVIAVAGGAGSVPNRGVESPVGLPPGGDLAMACQAFPVCNLLPQFVALGTVLHPFQAGVGLRQISGRQLRVAPVRPGADEDEADRPQPDGVPTSHQNTHR